MSDIPKVTIVLRDDIDLSSAKLAVQVGHPIDMVWLNRDVFGAEVNVWLDPVQGDRRIILKISSLERLDDFYRALSDEGANCKRIVDSSLHKLDEPTVTGIIALPSLTSYKKLSKLRLY